MSSDRDRVLVPVSLGLTFVTGNARTVLHGFDFTFPFCHVGQRALLLAMIALGAMASCKQSPARAEVTPEPQGDPRRGEYLTTIFACQECHTLREPDGVHLDRSRLFAGGIPFAGPWGLVHSANVSIPAGSFPDRVLEDAIRGRLAWKFQMPTDLYRGMAADDMRDVVAFVKTLRPVSSPLPENHFEPSYVPPGPLPDVHVPEHALELIEIEEEIHEGNKTRTPYEFLLPSRIPQSINI